MAPKKEPKKKALRSPSPDRSDSEEPKAATKRAKPTEDFSFLQWLAPGGPATEEAETPEQFRFFTTPEEAPKPVKAKVSTALVVTKKAKPSLDGLPDFAKWLMPGAMQPEERPQDLAVSAVIEAPDGLENLPGSVPELMKWLTPNRQSKEISDEDCRKLAKFNLRWDCEVCGGVFRRKPHLLAHYAVAHLADPTGQAALVRYGTGYGCPFCHKRFRTPVDLLSHKRMGHQEIHGVLEECAAYDEADGILMVAMWLQKVQAEWHQLEKTHATLTHLSATYRMLLLHSAEAETAVKQLAVRELLVLCENVLKAVCISNVDMSIDRGARQQHLKPDMPFSPQPGSSTMFQCMAFLGRFHLLPKELSRRLDNSRRLRNAAFHEVGWEVSDENVKEQENLAATVLEWGYTTLELAGRLLRKEVTPKDPQTLITLGNGEWAMMGALGREAARVERRRQKQLVFEEAMKEGISQVGPLLLMPSEGELTADDMVVNAAIAAGQNWQPGQA